MTVEQLIEQLRRLPPDTLVVLSQESEINCQSKRLFNARVRVKARHNANAAIGVDGRDTKPRTRF